MRDLRVLEVGSSLATAYCTWLFAAAGSDVVCLEPAGGVPLRRAAPLLPAVAGDGQPPSATWEFLAAGKRSVVLDVADPAADRLLQWADVVVSHADGDPDAALALHQRISRLNPAAVHAVTSGFGLTGPYRDWRSSPLVDWAAGGQLYLTGEPDREPLQGGGPWASYLTGATAALGAQAAMFHAARTGEGQLVDVGAMEAMAALHQWTITMYTHTGCIKGRWGNRFGETFHPIALYPCRDGWISIVAPSPQQWAALCRVMGLDDLLDDESLVPPGARFDRAAEIDPGITGWLATRSVDEAVAELQAAAVPASRLCAMADLLDEPQLDHRRFWARPDHLGPGARMPANPFSLVPDRAAAPRPAPALGEHTTEVLAELDGPDDRTLPQVELSSVRVLECTLAWAGPLAGRFLGDLGLDVVKVEHPTARAWRGGAQAADPGWRWGELPPPAVRSAVFPNAEPGERPWNRMGIFNKMNRSKRGLCLDAKAGEGPEVLRRLVASADVVLHNFSPRGSRTLGVDADAVRRVNPSAVSVAMSGYGATGPLSTRVSYGPVLQAHAGFDEATGYLGAGPTRLGIAFPDAVGGVHGAIAVLAALWEREVTGADVHVDVSQFETLLVLGGELLLATSVTGRNPVRPGNRSPSAAPQGVYPCAGDDRWVALTVGSDDEWARLVDLVARPGLATLRCATAAQRAEHHDHIDAELSAWTAARPPMAAASALQAIGLAAFPAATNRDLVEDPHLADRGFIVTIDQPDVGPIAFPGFPIHFSRTEISLRPAPPLGAHNAEVLAELGIDPATIAHLEADGVLATSPPPA